MVNQGFNSSFTWRDSAVFKKKVGKSTPDYYVIQCCVVRLLASMTLVEVVIIRDKISSTSTSLDLHLLSVTRL